METIISVVGPAVTWELAGVRPDQVAEVVPTPAGCCRHALTEDREPDAFAESPTGTGVP